VVFDLSDSSIRIKDETYKAVVRTRGSFEQTFGMKLTLDDAIFLAAAYINVAYEEFQALQNDKLITIVTKKDGSIDIKWTSLDKIVTKVLPRLILGFGNFKQLLNAKEMLKAKNHKTEIAVDA
jgi:hypothetical protein